MIITKKYKVGRYDMSISKKIEKFHKNRVEIIKKMSNGYERDMAIGALVSLI